MSLTILDVLGLSGNIISIVFFFLPMLIIIELFQKKDTSKIPWLLFIFTCLNCEVWAIYGIKINAWPIYVCNGFGLITNLFYLISYFLFINESKIRKSSYLALILLGFLIIELFFHFHIKNNDLVGGIACLLNVFMFASPLQNISKVYKLKDNSFIPIHISICLVINCIIWTSYGILKSMDYFIIFPNVLGLFLSSLQIYLWFEFKNPKPNIIKYNKSQYLDDKDFNDSDEELKGNENDKAEIHVKIDSKN